MSRKQYLITAIDNHHTTNSMKLVIPLQFISWKKTPNDAMIVQRQSQFTPKMKANAVPRLLSSLVWIDQYNECNGMTSYKEFMSFPESTSLTMQYLSGAKANWQRASNFHQFRVSIPKICWANSHSSTSAMLVTPPVFWSWVCVNPTYHNRQIIKEAPNTNSVYTQGRTETPSGPRAKTLNGPPSWAQFCRGKWGGGGDSRI